MSLSDKMYSYRDISTLHLEVSSYCNARCPMCARNAPSGGLNPRLKPQNLSLSDFKNFFPASFLKQLKKILLCGNFGDPAANINLIEILKYIKEANSTIRIQMHTNGGLRTAAFWSELAGILDDCVFSIDGLQNTNHLYRLGVQWQNLIENAETFIKAGGHAQWHFLVFKHNEHQVEEAQKFAKEMGFKKFQAKATARFLGKRSDEQMGLKVFSTAGEYTHTLFPPESIKYQNEAAEKTEQLILQKKSWDQHLDESKISCKVVSEKSLYVTAEGEVYPCCWLGQELSIEAHDQRTGALKTFFEDNNLNITNISLRNKSLEEIIQSSFFQKDIPDSWNKKSLNSGKLRTCSRICGMDLDLFKAQFLP